jgi:hypothetical protein
MLKFIIILLIMIFIFNLYNSVLLSYLAFGKLKTLN